MLVGRQSLPREGGAPAALGVHHGIVRDAKEPGGEATAALEAPQTAPRLDEDLLRDVGGILIMAERGAHVAVDAVVVPPVERVEGGGVGPRRSRQCGVVCRQAFPHRHHLHTRPHVRSACGPAIGYHLPRCVAVH